MAIDQKTKKQLDLVIRMLDDNYPLEDGLSFLHSVQSITSDLNPDCIPEVGDEPSPDQIRTYFLALIGETYELMNELNWKPWKKSKQVNKARVIDEFADVLAFLGIIVVYMQRMGISPAALADGYATKTRINIDRFLGKVEGYYKALGTGTIKFFSINPNLSIHELGIEVYEAPTKEEELDNIWEDDFKMFGAMGNNLDGRCMSTGY